MSLKLLVSKFRIVVIVFLATTVTVYSQSTRLSLDLNVGMPASMTFFTPTFSTYGGVGLRYNFVKEISLAGRFEIGTMSGKNNSPNSSIVYPVTNNNYLSFSNNFYQYTGEVNINFERIFGLRRYLHRINPYGVIGLGMIHCDNVAVDVNGNDSRRYNKFFYTAYFGLNMRYYFNPSLDLLIGSNFCMAQTYYNDAVPYDKKTDNYLLSSVGVSYKFGARKDRQHIEWNNVILKDRIYIPDIEKHQGQPLDAAGNFFLFHKDTITRILAQNADLQTKSQELETKSKELEAKNATQQKQIDSMQNQVTAIQVALDTIKNQKATEKIVEKVVIDTVRTNGKVDNKVVSKLESKTKEQQNQINNLQKQVDELRKELKDKPKSAPQNTEVVKPKVEQPIIKAEPKVEPNVETPTKKSEPKKVEPAKREEVKKQQAPQVDVANNGKLPSNSITEGLNKIDNVVTPVATYNIIAGAYSGEKYANIFRDKMRNKGYQAAVFKSNINSKIYRVCVFSSDDKSEAMSAMRKVRVDIDKGAWIHVYHQK